MEAEMYHIGIMNIFFSAVQEQVSLRLHRDLWIRIKGKEYWTNLMIEISDISNPVRG